MIRLTALELRNFKNVSHGRIVLSDKSRDSEDWSADVVGIYGQNGSGKTSVVNALLILKWIWSCGVLPDACEDCLAVGAEAFSIKAEAVSSSPDVKLFSYEIRVSTRDGEPYIAGEQLVCRSLADVKPTKRAVLRHCVVDDSTKLGPQVDWNALKAVSKDAATDLLVAQRLAKSTGGSLLFSKEFAECAEKMSALCKSRAANGGRLSKAASKAAADALEPTIELRERLRDFAVRHLAVLAPWRQAESMFNILRMSAHEGLADGVADAFLTFDLEKPLVVPQDEVSDIETTVGTISVALGALVPGLGIGVQRLGTIMADDGAISERVEITATRGSVTVPLRAESEGIKKLVGILVLLLDVYAKPEACVAIDELDSGVFEFLLGEILQVLQENGRGQLIFTAHNLRPLETLDKSSLVFTTTNPDNRYVTFKGVKPTNNLRSQYLRAINLGGQPETIYEQTSKYEIDGAFYDASHVRG